jgi:homospermidine synthase
MSQYPVHVAFPGRLIFVGFGSIGQGVLPLILRHVGISPSRSRSSPRRRRLARTIAAEYGVRFIRHPLTRENYTRTCSIRWWAAATSCSTCRWTCRASRWCKLCWDKGALYLDTCIEPWVGGYTDPTVSPSRAPTTRCARRRSRCARPSARADRRADPRCQPRPRLALRQAGLLNIAADTGVEHGDPNTRAEWAALAHKLGVKVIHIAERDTQVASRPKEPGEFVNTWSVDGFVGEGCQPAELGWGSHEKNWPRDGKKHDFGRGSAIYLMQPGAGTRVRTWTPMAGHFHGFLITHGESISISDYLTIKRGEQVVYRPTVHYAYHPCDDAVLSVHELAGRNWVMQDRKRIMMEEIVKGVDELGVLLAGHKKNAYWYGSQLSVQEARAARARTTARPRCR